MISSIWNFLLDSDNRAALKWIGGVIGSAIPAGLGLLAYFGYFERSPTASNGDAANFANVATTVVEHHCTAFLPLDHEKTKLFFETATTDPISAEQIIILNKCEAWIAKNEIYARNGYVFKTDFLNDYFKQKAWYKPGGFAGLNPVEEGNVAMLDRYVKGK